MRLKTVVKKANERWRSGMKHAVVHQDEVSPAWRRQRYTQLMSWDGRQLINPLLGFRPGDVLDNDTIVVRVEIRIVSVGRRRRSS